MTRPLVFTVVVFAWLGIMAGLIATGELDYVPAETAGAAR